MQASRWLLTGLTAAAVAGGLVMGDLTASAIDPFYRQVGTRADETFAVDPHPRTQPAPIAFTPISGFGEWPDAAAPPPDPAFLQPARAVIPPVAPAPVEAWEAIAPGPEPTPVPAAMPDMADMAAPMPDPDATTASIQDPPI